MSGIKSLECDHWTGSSSQNAGVLRDTVSHCSREDLREVDRRRTKGVLFEIGTVCWRQGVSEQAEVLLGE